MAFKGYMVEVVDAGTSRLRWRVFIGVGARRPDSAARARIREIRDAVWSAHGPARHVKVTRRGYSTAFPAGALDFDDERWYRGLPAPERRALDYGERKL